MRQLLIHLCNRWPTCDLGCERPAVSLANNGSEQVIGRFKWRSRSVRSCESTAGVAAAVLLTSRAAS